MLKFLYKLKDGQQVPVLPVAAPLLPSPDDGKTPEERKLIAAVNKKVNEQLSVARRGKNGKYNRLDDETRAKIAKKCLEVGPRKTSGFFRNKGLNLNESTIRSIKKSFCDAKKSQSIDDPTFQKKKRGRPLLLGAQLDSAILGYLC